MHYYQFNIGDYAKSTKYLEPMEDLIYRRLLDICYDSEKPLPKSVEKVTKLIGLKNFAKETQAILDEYFKLTKNGYIQKRVNKELGKYRAKADSARANGKKGGRPKITQPVNSANPTITQLKAKQETITNNHKPIKSRAKAFSKPTAQMVDDFANTENLSASGFFDFYESNGWRAGKNPMKNWKAALRGWSRRNNDFNKKGSPIGLGDPNMEF
jgi:uncharacterized protein YdaU (DUF1376 family)